MWNWFQVNDTEQLRRQVNIGSGNCLVPSGNKPLPEPMLAQFYDHTSVNGALCAKTVSNYQQNAHSELKLCQNIVKYLRGYSDDYLHKNYLSSYLDLACTLIASPDISSTVNKPPVVAILTMIDNLILHTFTVNIHTDIDFEGVHFFRKITLISNVATTSPDTAQTFVDMHAVQTRPTPPCCHHQWWNQLNEA